MGEKVRKKLRASPSYDMRASYRRLVFFALSSPRHHHPAVLREVLSVDIASGIIDSSSSTLPGICMYDHTDW